MRVQLIAIATLLCLAAPAALAASSAAEKHAAITDLAVAKAGDGNEEAAPAEVLALDSIVSGQADQQQLSLRKLLQSNSSGSDLIIIQGGGPKGGYVYCGPGKLPSLCTGVTDKRKATKFEVLVRKVRHPGSLAERMSLRDRKRACHAQLIRNLDASCHCAQNGTRTYYRLRPAKSNNCLSLLTNNARTVVSVVTCLTKRLTLLRARAPQLTSHSTQHR